MGTNQIPNLDDYAMLKRFTSPRLREEQVEKLVAQFSTFTRGIIPSERALQVVLAYRTELVNNSVLSYEDVQKVEQGDDDPLQLHGPGNDFFSFVAFCEAYQRYAPRALEAMLRGEEDAHAAILAFAGMFQPDAPHVARVQTLVNELRFMDPALPSNTLKVDGVHGNKTATALAHTCEAYGCRETDLAGKWRDRIEVTDVTNLVPGRYSTMNEMISYLRERVKEKPEVLETLIQQQANGDSTLTTCFFDPVTMQKYLPEIDHKEFRDQVQRGVRRILLKDETYAGYVPMR